MVIISHVIFSISYIMQLWNGYSIEDTWSRRSSTKLYKNLKLSSLLEHI